MPIIEYQVGEGLTVDQNLYDQPPYHALVQIAQQSDIPLDLFRRAHVKAAHDIEEGILERTGIDLSLVHPDELPSLIRSHQYLARHQLAREGFGVTAKNLSLIMNLLTQMAPSPLWHDYLAAYQDSDSGLPGIARRYRRDGQINATHRGNYDEEPTPTYPRWLSQEVVRRERASDLERRKVVLGVEEIFPQDFAEEAMLHPLAEQAGRARRWRITIQSIKQEPTDTIRVPRRKQEILPHLHL